jgi:hypothetical protein
MPRKITSRPSAQQATLLYAEWKAKALTLLGGRPGTMSERELKRAFFTGLLPEEVAAEVAALAGAHRRNVGGSRSEAQAMSRPKPSNGC